MSECRNALKVKRAAAEPRGEGEQIQAAQQKDPEAMAWLIERHKALIHAMAGRVCCPSFLREELVQAGNIGLMQAIRRYDMTQNVKLSTYAVPWILGEMKRCMREAEMTCVSLEEERREEGASLLQLLRGDSDVDIAGLDLRMAMEKLDREAQMLISLRYLRDKTQKETALLMKKSQSQISKLEQRALDHLRKLLA